MCPPLLVVICYFYTIPLHAKCVFSVSCSKLIFSSAGKWLLLLRGEWRYFISHRRGFEPSPTLSSLLISSLLWEQWVSDGCALLPLSRTGQQFLLPACFSYSQGVEDHLSATRRTRIDVQHSLGIQLLLHFKLQGQLGKNPCQSCQARKHETNSPRSGCGVKHRDKGQASHHKSLALCLHMFS